MKYRVYVDSSKGYKYENTVSFDDLFFLLDELILHSKEEMKVLVIEHNDELDSDLPFYLFSGSKIEYIAFKEVIAKSNERLVL